MAEFTTTVHQNEFLPDGGTDVHAIVSVTCAGAGTVAPMSSASGEAGEIIIVDVSGSMDVQGVQAAAYAASAALDQIVDGVWFAIVAGNHEAALCYPNGMSAAMARMSAQTRLEAKRSLQRLAPGGGTAMGRWLLAAGQLFGTVPSLTKRHAILLTDGANQHETPDELSWAIEQVRGRFEVDCRGLGAAWQVAEVRRIAEALMGTVDLIRTWEGLPEDFAQLMQQSMGRGVSDTQVRVWAPQGAEVLFVKQVSPTLEDLSARRVEVNPLTGGYDTGAWGDETRDYHVAVRLAPKAIGQEQLAARVQLAVGSDVRAQGLVKARWSADSLLTAQISPEVAHYTGQTELASAIQDGLRAKAIGDDLTATSKLGRAVQLARETGDEAATSRLSRVVDIEDASTGRVRLRRNVDKLDEMELDTASTKTTRVRPS
ncbi:VWA domain-containing protein [Ornithinimicrobium cerasi]|uniref:von Willebrand factor type A domain-containing protein n=1 Tax=Ornithinimicrobium cerasi TaxID=2248773 RepID=A0A285VDC7_9MICO|nr:VWA domain-containing protein [Ornithinimicrobium cerasi]SOC52135.1 von Willebrand factor type A domain-containing protein [Ornithinimicrobium cerasi]